MIVDPAVETISLDALAHLQERRLRELVDRLLVAGGVQAERLRAAGVSVGADVRLADLATLPMTAKPDLWAAYPLGMAAVSSEDLAVVHGSSGTGGRPTLVGYTAADVSVWARVCARALGGAGAHPGSLVHNAYGYGLFTGGLGIHQGARELGATVVPASGGFTQRQVRLVCDLRPDVLTCTPSYAVALGEALAAAGAGPEQTGLRVGVFGAEPWSEAMRDHLESLLGVTAVDIYGLSEIIGPGVACECAEGRSGLHIAADHFLPEVVEPATGVPVALGQPGELVFSTLTRQACPLLRYRTGDIAALLGGECPCGRTLVRMTRVLGRRDDMLVVRGVNVYPSEVEAVLLAQPRVGPQWLLVHDLRGRGELVVACEGAPGATGTAAARADLAEALVAALRERLGLRVRVVVLERGRLPRAEAGKATRVLRWTDGPPPLAELDADG